MEKTNENEICANCGDKKKEHALGKYCYDKEGNKTSKSFVPKNQSNSQQPLKASCNGRITKLRGESPQEESAITNGEMLSSPASSEQLSADRKTGPERQHTSNPMVRTGESPESEGPVPNQDEEILKEVFPVGYERYKGHDINVNWITLADVKKAIALTREAERKSNEGEKKLSFIEGKSVQRTKDFVEFANLKQQLKAQKEKISEETENRIVYTDRFWTKKRGKINYPIIRDVDFKEALKTKIENSPQEVSNEGENK